MRGFCGKRSRSSAHGRVFAKSDWSRSWSRRFALIGAVRQGSRGAKLVAREIADSGTTSADCLALAQEVAPDTFTWERLEGWRLVGLRLLQAEPDLDYGPRRNRRSAAHRGLFA